jgi:hypothetical protein
MKRLHLAIVGLIAALLLTETVSAQKRTCTGSAARHALDEAVRLRSWQALYHSYRLYRQCDDGAIGEGYSESVARILVDHWESLQQLDDIVSTDPGFRSFVLGHLDATLNMADVERVRKEAQNQCPTRLRVLCSELIKQTNSAIKESMQ